MEQLGSWATALSSPLAPEAGEVCGLHRSAARRFCSAGRSPRPPGPYYIWSRKVGVKTPGLVRITMVLRSLGAGGQAGGDRQVGCRTGLSVKNSFWVCC